MNESAARVLVVEDQDSVRTLLRRMLEKAGFRVELASNGEEALSRLKRAQDIDVIVSDLLMPGVHGVMFLKLVREFAPKVPLIVLTGSEISESTLALAGCQLADYLRKPLETSRVVAAVHAAVQDRRTGSS